MSNQLLASKVVIVEEEPRLRNITGLPTAVVAAVGITERGPVGQAILVTSFEEFVGAFGSFTPNSDLALAASAFFENGGQVLYVVRTVHYGALTDSATATSKVATLKLKDRAVAPLDTLRVDGKWDGTYALRQRHSCGHRERDERCRGRFQPVRRGRRPYRRGVPERLDVYCLGWNMTVRPGGAHTGTRRPMSDSPCTETHWSSVLHEHFRGENVNP